MFHKHVQKKIGIIIPKNVEGIDFQPLNSLNLKSDRLGYERFFFPVRSNGITFIGGGRRRFDSWSLMRVEERERERERHCCALRFAKPRFDRVFRHYAVQLLPSFLPSPLRSIDHSSPWLTSDIVKGFKTPFEMRAMRQMILLNITPAMRSLILPARSFVHILFSRKRDEIYLPL